MKIKIKIIRNIICAFILIPALAFSTGMKEKPTIVDIAAGDDSFTALVTALKAADLVSVLDGDGPFTVFAPTMKPSAKSLQKHWQTYLSQKKRTRRLRELNSTNHKTSAAR